MSHCNSLLSLIQCYMKAVLYCITFVSCLLFWPIAVLFIKYYNDGKYYLSKGNDTYKSTVGIRIVHLNTGWKCLIFKWQPFKNETNSSAVVMPKSEPFANRTCSVFDSLLERIRIPDQSNHWMIGFRTVIWNRTKHVLNVWFGTSFPIRKLNDSGFWVSGNLIVIVWAFWLFN